jgi:Ca2+-binding RTX toxin-like protein
MTPRRPKLTRLAAAATCALAASAALAVPASGKAKTTFEKRLLTIEGGNGKDRVALSCGTDDTVRVNGKRIKGDVPCRKVVEINAVMGGGNDVVDFTGVDEDFGRARFSGFGNGTGAFAELGDGDDRYVASRFAFNLVYGQGGDDRGNGGGRRDILIGGAGDDVMNGGAGRDVLRGKAGNDRLSGGSGADILAGNSGDDLLIGGAGNDLLGGGTGRDRLRGGAGRDVLLGGKGMDQLRGGPGRDREKQNPG